MTKGRGIRRVKTPSGTRYMRAGRFVSAAAYKRSLAAKKKRRSNPPKKRTARPLKKRRTTARKRMTVSGKTRKNPTTKRKAAAKKAARTRASNAKKRSEAAKKAARTRKRNASKKVRRNPTKRRKTVAKRRRRRLPPRIKSGPRKGQFKKRKRNPSRKRRKTTSRKRRVRRNPAKNRWVRKTIGKGKRKKRASVSTNKIRARARRGKRSRYKTYRIRRKYNKKTGNYSHRLIRSNPTGKAMLGVLKNGALFWAGLTGMRVLNGVIKEQVDKQAFAQGKTGTTAKLIASLPAALGFGLSVYLLPKVVKKANILSAIQMGASVALVDVLFENFVKPSLPASVTKYLPGAVGGYVSVPMSEYVDYDNRLGEYVDYDNRYSGFEVSEALAADDMAFMQTGGAGGIFAKTSLGWG